ncbi:hypothetical protein MA16_Dca026622 [Dendrobium catenatum]|uniref:EF-hand domain-containing protein n=1 Tax=Dendrobium catenatum TaxID=906689 RepID=A0A2I0VKW7_9ASPA|nr:hypothetical protein MA16_Dca026622 [Dendrobium catenatum]
MVVEIDRDYDGCITLDELRVISLTTLDEQVASNKFYHVFAVFEDDEDGNISILMGVNCTVYIRVNSG